jgi:phosphopantetheinyl transferase
VSATIHVFYYTGCHTSTLLPGAESLLARINRVRRERFARRAPGPQQALDLVTQRVLELAMVACGHSRFKLRHVEYPDNNGISGKPYWTQGVADFSISHTQGMVACAVAKGCSVGLDVEEQREIRQRTVRRLLADDAVIARDLTAQNALSRWTQVEAVLKGAGLGVMHGREIQWQESTTRLHERQWWLHRVDCGPRHQMHLAVDVPQMQLHVQPLFDL